MKTKQLKAFLHLGKVLKFVFRGMIIKVYPPIVREDGTKDFSRSIFINNKLISLYKRDSEEYILWSDYSTMTKEERNFKVDYLLLVDMVFFGGIDKFKEYASDCLGNFIIEMKFDFKSMDFYKVDYFNDSGIKKSIIKEFNEDRAKLSIKYKERLFDTNIIRVTKYK